MFLGHPYLEYTTITLIIQVAILVNSYDETKQEENQTICKKYLENGVDVTFRLDNSEVSRSKIRLAEKSYS